MTGRLFGIPLVIWGALCCALTVLWVVVWPSAKAAATSGFRFVVLRWFHTLAWLFLAIAAFLAALDAPGGAATARPVALLALLTYLVFMGTFLTAR
jgi:hypothetical protein